MAPPILFAGKRTTTRESDGEEVSDEPTEDTEKKEGIINITRRQALFGAALGGIAHGLGVPTNIKIPKAQTIDTISDGIDNLMGQFAGGSIDPSRSYYGIIEVHRDPLGSGPTEALPEHPFSLTYNSQNTIDDTDYSVEEPVVVFEDIDPTIEDTTISAAVEIRRAQQHWERLGLVYTRDIASLPSMNSSDKVKMEVKPFHLWTSEQEHPNNVTGDPTPITGFYQPKTDNDIGDPTLDLVEATDNIKYQNLEPEFTWDPSVGDYPNVGDDRSKETQDETFELRYRFESSQGTITEDQIEKFTTHSSIPYGFGMAFGVNFGEDEAESWQSL